METIHKGIQSGISKAIIMEASMTGKTIMVRNHLIKIHLINLANKLNIKIKSPKTINNIIEKSELLLCTFNKIK